MLSLMEWDFLTGCRAGMHSFGHLDSGILGIVCLGENLEGELGALDWGLLT